MGTSQLIYTANQMTGFYMNATLAFNGLIYNNFFFQMNFLYLVLHYHFSLLAF